MALLLFWGWNGSKKTSLPVIVNVSVQNSKASMNLPS